MHVKRTRKGEGGGPARKSESVGKRMAKNERFVRPSGIEWNPYGVEVLVEAARLELDAPERLQSPPGYVTEGKDSGTVVHGTFSACSMPTCLLEAVWIP